jgi:pimeloyl-ACP methyl ester carboxylesterase
VGRYLCRILPIVLALLLAGCGGTAGDEEGGPEPGELVRFQAADGVQLEGRSFGDGDVAVVFSHMGRGGDSQLAWYPLARELSAQGYRAVTYNRRGVCSEAAGGCSRGTDVLGDSWNDVVGAYRYVKEEGARSVVFVGASIGAMTSLYAAARPEVDVAALIEVGGINDASGYSFERGDIARIEGAKLFVSSADDSYGGANAARQWHRWARAPKQLVIFKGAEHGTDMIRPGSETRPRLIGLAVEFLRRHVPPGGK